MKVFGLGIAGLLTGILLQSAAMAVTPLSDPATVTYTALTESSPALSNHCGYACALSANFALIGIPGRNDSRGGFDLYRKTPAMTWELLQSVGYDLGPSRFGTSVAIDESTMLIGAYERSAGILSEAGSVMVRSKNSDGNWGDSVELFASEPHEYDAFGYALALDSATMAITAPGMSNYAGCVYLFTNTAGTWYESSIIHSPSGGANTEFGTAVALQDNLLVVGATGYDSSRGAAFVYQRENGSWTLQRTLTGSHANDHYFGTAISMDQNWLLIGGASYVDGKDMAGSVSVYEQVNGSLSNAATLKAANTQANALFGEAVSVDGHLAVVGAPFYDGSQTDSGQLSMFMYDGLQWTFVRELPFHPVDSSGRLGSSVAVKRNHIFSGAPNMDCKGTNAAGCVFLYDVDQTWMTQGTSSSDFLGYQVGISHSHAAIAAPNEDVEGVDSAGKVYMYRRFGTIWTNQTILTEPAEIREAGNDFGRAISLDCNTIIVGAPYRTVITEKEGAIYIFKHDESSWKQVFTATGTSVQAQLGSSVAISPTYACATYSNSASHKSWIEMYHCASNGIWSKKAEVHPPIAYPGAIGFGCDIAISEELLVVGAYRYNSDAGAAFIYRLMGGVWQNIGVATSGIGEKHGQGVALHGDMIAVGSPGYESNKGRISLYKVYESSVTLVTNIAAPDGSAAGDYFGFSLAFAENGTSLIVSSYKKHLNTTTDTGAAHTYRYHPETKSWTFDGTTYPPLNSGMSVRSSWFGKDIAACGDTVVAGMYRYDGGGGPFSGGAVTYRITPRTAPADFDGDGITDIGCYYAPNGYWYVYKSASSQLWTTAFGYAQTTPFVNDFDGDWITDFGCYDAYTGYWFTYGSIWKFWVDSFGAANTKRLTGDFDGDALADQAYFDPATATFYLMRSASGYQVQTFGSLNAEPVTGDFDGDGIDDYGTYYAPEGLWMINCSRDGEWSTRFGYEGTTPITGDFDGDNIIDFGCYYPPTGAWYIYKSHDGFWVNNFGYEGTLPVTGDFDGDGTEDFGCYYPPNGTWYVYKSSDGFWVNNFGYEGTVPMN